MRLQNLLLLLVPALAIGSQPPAAVVSRVEAYTLAQHLSKDLVDALYQVRAYTEHASGQERARDDDDGGGDGDGDTSKLINQLASSFRPVMKQLLLVVNTILPAGPQRQLVKAAADAVDSLLPLILKYALGL
ncbi:hypothetical protein GGF42_001818 [Coemansia sp. RSA 2424]|nr:hypothetical protein GGF42_001818 [Coemansia sp. RSA 2424]